MKDKIQENIDNAAELERLYRSDKQTFKHDFDLLYPSLKGSALATFWHERLNYQASDFSFGSRTELIFVLLASLLAGLIAKFPAIFSIDPEFFYPRNIGFIVFPFLSAYFLRQHKAQARQIIITALVFLAALVFINLFPGDDQSDTFILTCIHLLICFWMMLGVSFTGAHLHSTASRMNFLKYNGDLLVMMALILISGVIMTGITIGLFSLIGFAIQKFYMENIVVLGLAASPVLATYLVRENQQLVGKVTPVIAKIFSPLVLITLAIYLIAIIYSGKDPYNDREFLIIFNGMLVGVLALIVFSVAETSGKEQHSASGIILLALSVVTICVSGIALSAIVFRIVEMGITPNRLAVLGANVLILINLILISWQLFKALKTKGDFSGVEKSIAQFLPYYGLWAVFVSFVLPYLFGFR